MPNDYLESYCKEILACNPSIRFAGIANQLGSLIATQYREGLVPLMTKEETSQYSIQAVLRAATREDFESKIGRLEYSIGKYEKLIRATVPIIFSGSEGKRFYLLLSFDADSDAKLIIDKKVLPHLAKNKENFIQWS
jgi:hypothetical protein